MTIYGESREERIRLEAHVAAAGRKLALRERMASRGFDPERMWWVKGTGDADAHTARNGWRLVLLKLPIEAYEQGFPPDSTERVLADLVVTTEPRGGVLWHEVEVTDHVLRARLTRLCYAAAGAVAAGIVAALFLGG